MIRPSAKIASSNQDVWTIFNTAAAETPGVVHLGQGFMKFAMLATNSKSHSFNPPDFLLDAAKKALDIVSCNQYSHTKGRERLRKAIANVYSPLFNRKINYETEVVVTAGANEGMFSAWAAFLDQDDEAPRFFYVSNIAMNGGKLVYCPIHPPSDETKNMSSAEWTVDMQELRSLVTPKTKVITLNTPHNPLGKMFSTEELLNIGQIAVDHNLLILSDEVYDRLDYTPHRRIATLNPEFASRTLTVCSAGKTFGATGWRVGWLIGVPDLIKYVSAAHTRICFTVNSPLQEACAYALEVAEEKNYYKQTVSDYSKRFATIRTVFDDLGLPYVIPQGGYFLMVNFSKVSIPSGYKFPDSVTVNRAKDFAMAYWLLKEIGVVAIPPTEFFIAEHAHLAENYLRFAFCKDVETLKEAVCKLRKLEAYIH
ncbi:putative aminotransferase [Neolecta irregularis DAH-3]|uniref:Putative aminotransferase n=1 Tax=Neolecta irregularis (strain DAH-3) TaxID=1198029 RepID=A0A1U7LHZ9_NEOID|nr:putative aminotransferase [Neolecta irregularis DAH-3]|eukprot:OLL22151.1 putative aminotransferase [Neolecta irregularis DAH-3]